MRCAANRSGRDQALIVARILNYAEIVATLPSRQRAPAGRTDRRAAVGRLDRAHLLSGRRRHLRLVRGTASCRSATTSRRSIRCSATRSGSARLSIDVAVSFGVEIGSGRSLVEPPRQRAGRRRRSRARRPQVEISRPRPAAGRVVAAVAAEPARYRDRQGRGVGRLPAQARPRIEADHRRRGAGALDPSRKGPDQPRPNSSPPPSSTTGSAN